VTRYGALPCAQAVHGRAAMGQSCHCEHCCPCCAEAAAKKKAEDAKPKFPIIVRFLHQNGETEHYRLDPPTFEELVRYVKCQFKIKEPPPHIFHQDELGVQSELKTKDDFEHAVRVTKPEKDLVIVVGFYKEKGGKPCCCCGRADPPPKRPAPKFSDPILFQNQAPPGLRSHLVLPDPYLLWDEMGCPHETAKNDSPKFIPMFKALMK
jgi:hypothetical protein